MLAAVVCLAVVVVVLLVERSWHARGEAATVRHLLNAEVAKDGRDLAIIEREPAPRLRAVGDDDRPPRLPDGL